MDLTAFYDHEFDEHEAIVRATRDAVSVPFAALCGAAQKVLSAGNKIVFFGNGGSAADSRHLATEMLVRYKTNRAPLVASALNTDSSLLTAVLTGRSGGDLPRLANPLVMVPSITIERIQKMHIMIGHMLCDVFEQTCDR